MKLYNQDELHPSFIKVFCLKCCVLICLYYCITVLLDFWNVFRWEITFVTFSASQYIFFVSADSALSSPAILVPPTSITLKKYVCQTFLKLINEVTFLMSSGKLFHLLITLKLKKFLLISRLHSVKFRFILRVENLVSR